MTKEITIGGKQITFTSNGATPLFYARFFHKDLMKQMSANGDELQLATENIPELAFIMAKQADKADMAHLTDDMYIEWLSLFNPLDIAVKGNEIFMVYIADSMNTVEPKKKVGKQNA